MGFGEAVAQFYKNYFNFMGRSRRSEFWWPVLLYILVYLGVFLFATIGEAMFGENDVIYGIIGFVFLIFALSYIIPSISVSVRRLHDRNMSGWWYLLGFVPFGGFVLLYFFASEGTQGANKYGQDPKNPDAATADIFA